MKMNLSKSKYVKGLQCKKILWLEKNKPNEAIEIDNTSILEQGDMVHEVARYLFGEHINIEYTENLSQMIKDTYSTIESYHEVVITEASFNYKNNFCSIDILKKKGDTYEIYEVKSSTKLKDVYINDAAYQYYVLSNLGFKVTKCSVVVINHDYVRNGSLELDKLFLKQDITEDVLNLQAIVDTKISEINEYMLNEVEPKDDLDIKCFKPYECPFFKYCTRHLPDNNVFMIANMRIAKKVEYYKNRVYSFNDLLKCDINNKYRQQIMYELNDYPDYINKDKIKKFLNTLSYPLYFLDFETYQMPIPLYDGVSPYEQIPFQYSLHYYRELDVELKHLEYLAEGGIDSRRMLAEQLVKDIPRDVCILAYNMSFEKRIIKKLANLYPDLSDHLMNIYENIKDLMIPFQNRDYYNKAMKGSYSIKYVLPALFPNEEELDYHNLELVHNGSEAMNMFIKLANMDSDELKYTREQLLRYCQLDTYAMVKIYKKLMRIVK